MKAPKVPKPTAQQLAAERRTGIMLDEETAQVEKRLKAVTRGKLGTASLLAKGGSASTASPAASNPSMLNAGAASNVFRNAFGKSKK